MGGEYIQLSRPQIIRTVKITFLFQVFYKAIYSLQLAHDVDALRAFGSALSTTHTMTGLTKLRYRAVVTDEEGTAIFAVLGVLSVHGHTVFIHALVEMQQYAWNVDAVWARHTVLAIVARDKRVAYELLCRRVEEVHVILRQWLERREGLDVFLQMFHPWHTAQY